MVISGTVLDATSGAPVAGAQVTILMAGKELARVFTDDRGEFALVPRRTVEGQVVIFVIEREGYRRSEVSVDVVARSGTETVYTVYTDPVSASGAPFSTPRHDPHTLALYLDYVAVVQFGHPVHVEHCE